MAAKPEPIEARIVDVRMTFGSMVTFMVKWALAAIPAALILVLFGAAVVGMLSGIFGHH